MGCLASNTSKRRYDHLPLSREKREGHDCPYHKQCLSNYKDYFLVGIPLWKFTPKHQKTLVEILQKYNLQTLISIFKLYLTTQFFNPNSLHNDDNTPHTFHDYNLLIRAPWYNHFLSKKEGGENTPLICDEWMTPLTHLKILILGNSWAGKSTMIIRYLTGYNP